MGLGLSLRTGGGDFVAGGDSGGGVAECTPLAAFNLFNALIFLSAREVHALLHLGKLAEVLVMLVNNWSSPPLLFFALETTKPAEEAMKLSLCTNEALIQ